MEGRGRDVENEDYIIYGDGLVLCKWCSMIFRGIPEYAYHATGHRHDKKVDGQKRLLRGELSHRSQWGLCSADVGVTSSLSWSSSAPLLIGLFLASRRKLNKALCLARSRSLFAIGLMKLGETFGADPSRKSLGS